MSATATAAGRPPFTRSLAQRIGALRFDALPADVVARAKHSILDWLGVTLAGWSDPLVGKLIRVVDAEGGRPVATLLGLARIARSPGPALLHRVPN
jgi:2-methylcitrate dehydratase PrpD